MHLLLTDRLHCPRCGHGFGLVLMTSAMAERRVSAGYLGCANCRERYPIENGVADLRPSPRAPLETGGQRAHSAPEPESGIPPRQFATGLAAAMGAIEGGRPVLLVGGAAVWAPHLLEVLPDEVEIVTLLASPADGVPGTSGVVVGEAWPFPEGTLGGVTLLGDDASPQRLRTLGRLLDPRRRLVVIEPPEGIQARLGGAGLTRFVQGPGLAAAGR
ncbi:MAG: hypothetical protein HKO98_14425 [Gemmatimonadetes bacterium]|nr:hypothetical protein [Gemmatimonadota bacterium]